MKEVWILNSEKWKYRKMWCESMSWDSGFIENFGKIDMPRGLILLDENLIWNLKFIRNLNPNLSEIWTQIYLKFEFWNSFEIWTQKFIWILNFDIHPKFESKILSGNFIWLWIVLTRRNPKILSENITQINYFH